MANQPQNQLLSIQQGVTAQSWAGPAMADNNTVLGNTSEVVPAGNPAPGFATPGNLAVGQPGGANVFVIPNTDGSGASGSNLETVGANAGTAGGGGYYPAAATNPVPNPMIVAGWTIQNPDNNDDDASLYVTANPQYTAVHAANTNNIFTPTISGGTPAYTVSCVECVQTVGGVQSTLSAMPTGLTLTAATGAVANSVSSVAGTYVLGFRVQDSANPHNFAEYSVTVVLS